MQVIYILIGNYQPNHYHETKEKMENLQNTEIKHERNYVKTAKFSKNVNFLIICIGTVSIFAVPFIDQEKVVFWILLTIGITFIANGFYSLVMHKWKYEDEMFLYDIVVDDNKKVLNKITKEITITKHLIKLAQDEPGLVSVDDNNEAVLQSIKAEIERLISSDFKKEYEYFDVICFNGFESFRSMDDINSLISAFLERGYGMRILTVNPNLDFIAQSEIDHNMDISGERKYPSLINKYGVTSAFYDRYRDITELQGWASKINKKISNGGKIEIKYYNSLPTIHYYRIGTKLYVYSRTIGSKPLRYYRYKRSGDRDSFYEYTEYFDKLYNSKEFTLVGHNEYLNPYRLNPQMLAGNRIIQKILVNACRTLGAIIKKYSDGNILNKMPDFDVYVFLSLVDFPEPVDGIHCRYNIIACDNENADDNLSNCNPSSTHDMKIQERHVAGEVIRHKKTIFRTTCLGIEQCFYESGSWLPCVSLAVPITVKRDPNDSSSTSLRIIGIKNNYNRESLHSQHAEEPISIDSNVLGVLIFEFDNSIKECFFDSEKTMNDAQNSEVCIDTTYGVNSLLRKEAERCRDNIVAYLGLNSD